MEKKKNINSVETSICKIWANEKMKTLESEDYHQISDGVYGKITKSPELKNGQNRCPRHSTKPKEEYEHKILKLYEEGICTVQIHNTHFNLVISQIFNEILNNSNKPRIEIDGA